MPGKKPVNFAWTWRKRCNILKRGMWRAYTKANCKKIKNVTKRINGLLLKNYIILKELKDVRTKIGELCKQDLYMKIDNLNMSSAQKMPLKKCINVCKYESKTSRKYSSEWLLLCLLFHIQSSASYNFLRKHELLPLPSVSTIRRYLFRVNMKCGLDDKHFEAFKLKMSEKNEYEKCVNAYRWM